VALVQSALDDAELEAKYLELELTESLILENAEQTIQSMHALKSLGIGLSLDDFGTGYSSLSYLRHYPVDRIKIDQSFIRDMTEHAGSAALVRSILSMAYNLGLDTISEGVETVGQFGYLRKYLCQEMQGYLFSSALPQDDLTKLLRDGAKFEIGDKIPYTGNTLLLVDGDPAVADAVKEILHREVGRILIAADAQTGFELLADHDVDTLIADAGFLNRVKEMYPDTVRIFLSDTNDCAALIDAVNLGDFFKVVSKPIQAELLRKYVSEAFRHRRSSGTHRSDFSKHAGTGRDHP